MTKRRIGPDEVNLFRAPFLRQSCAPLLAFAGTMLVVAEGQTRTKFSSRDEFMSSDSIRIQSAGAYSADSS
jgi:hypothetical protein